MACTCQNCHKPCDCGETYCWTCMLECDDTVKNMVDGGRFHGVKLAVGDSILVNDKVFHKEGK